MAQAREIEANIVKAVVKMVNGDEDWESVTTRSDV
jgi:hypothetical protein